MKNFTALKRGLLVAATAGLFGVVVLAMRPTNSPEEKLLRRVPGQAAAGDWVMFGGTLQRNFVNTREKDILDDWDVANKTNIKWAANPGSKAYGGPVVAAGKI